jgi:hypothetical protein
MLCLVLQSCHSPFCGTEIVPSDIQSRLQAIDFVLDDLLILQGKTLLAELSEVGGKIVSALDES